ncbi:MAG TPA: YwbE family protein [Anaerolineales bacterium]
MAVPKRSEIHPGQRVQIIEKQNQRSGALTEGIVARILTNSPSHPHGIKVMLVDGKVGRVQAVVIQPGMAGNRSTDQEA